MLLSPDGMNVPRNGIRVSITLNSKDTYHFYKLLVVVVVVVLFILVVLRQGLPTAG